MRFPNREELEAIRRYQNGEKLSFSSGIADDEITYGYGKLDNNGYWEFPLPYVYLKGEDKEIVDISEGKKIVDISYLSRDEESK